MTAEQALALCVAKWGRGAAVRLIDLANGEFSEAEREAARRELAGHKASEPRLKQVEEFPEAASLGEYRAHTKWWHAAYEAWGKRGRELTDIAYRYQYVVIRPSGASLGYVDDHFAYSTWAYSWEEALQKSGVLP